MGFGLVSDKPIYCLKGHLKAMHGRNTVFKVGNEVHCRRLAMDDRDWLRTSYIYFYGLKNVREQRSRQ